MNEKTLEKVTGLSRRQIIMLQKNVIKRKNKIVVGLSYEYSDEEVEQFMLAKIFKDCGYTYSEIKKEMENYKNNKFEVIDQAIDKITIEIENLDKILETIKDLRKKEGNIK